MRYTLMIACCIGIASALNGCGSGFSTIPQAEEEYDVGVVSPEPYASYLKGLPPISLEEFALLAEEVMIGKPNASSKELSLDLVDALWERADEIETVENSARVRYLSYDLTDDERDLLVANWWHIGPAWSAQHDAFAESAARFSDQHGEDTIRDAFRHAYWNVLLSRRTSAGFARRFATAHESETPNSLATAMDLNNNYVGRRVWRENRYDWFIADQELADIVENYPRRKIRGESEISSRYLVYIRD